MPTRTWLLVKRTNDHRRFTVHVRRDTEPRSVSVTQFVSVRRGPIAPVLPVRLEVQWRYDDDAVLVRLSTGATNSRMYNQGAAGVYASYMSEKGLVGKEPYRPAGPAAKA